MLCQVLGIAILDSEGTRLAVKYLPLQFGASSSSSVPPTTASFPNGCARSALKPESASLAGGVSGGGGGGAGLSGTKVKACVAAADSRNGSAGAGSSRGGVADEPTGDRLLRDFASQTKLESQLTQKANRLTGRPEVEIVMVDKYLALVRSVNDVSIYVIGDTEENELMLLEVIHAVYQGLSNITNGQVGKRQVLEHLDSVFLMLDEVVDGGVILETDAGVITSRLNMTDGQPTASGGGTDGVVSDTTAFNQAISNARDNLMRSFLSGSS